MGGDLDIVQLLLSIKDINVNLRDNEMKTPFYKVIKVFIYSRHLKIDLSLSPLVSDGRLLNFQDFTAALI